MSMIKSILSKRGWNTNHDHLCTIELNELNVIRILTDLFDESLDAELALYFFKLSECCIGSLHSLKSVCKMIHILVSRNMNHIAVDFILHLVRISCSKEVSEDLLLKLFYETHNDRMVLQTVCSMLVDCYIKENKVSLALELTCQMKSFNMIPSIGVCNLLLKALLGLNQLDLAWDFLDQILRQGIGLNVSIVSLFIDKYCSKGHLLSAWTLLMDMKNYGIKPDVVAYTIIIDSLCKMSCLGEATSMLFKITRLGISPDSVLVSSVVEGYWKAGKPKEAVNVINYFNLKPNIFVYNSFITKLCADGDMVKASLMFQEMFELGLLPDCVSYTTIIGGYCKDLNMNRAFQYFGKMLKC
ncbi:hypothetical protein CRYUN_Cryun09bG0141400 [Craigia yunnanensis]